MTTTLWIKSKSKVQEQTNLISALSDTLHKTKNSLGQQVDEIQQIRTDNADIFIKMKSQDTIIQKLQKDVKTNKSRLGDNGSVTEIGVDTKGTFTAKTDSVQYKDSVKVGNIVYLYPTYKSFIIKDKWISAHIIADKDSTTFKPIIHNEFTLVLGEEPAKKGFFHKFDDKIPFAELTVLSPYSDTKYLRSYQKSATKSKTWGIGIQAGYGGQLYNNQINLSPYIGVGISKNLIRW